MKVRWNENTLRTLQNAIRRNPDVIRSESLAFMTRAKAVLMTTINRNPWRVGGRGGGAPVDSRRLLQSHQDRISPFELRIFPEPRATKIKSPWNTYAELVHDGTSRMKRRPWLDYAVKSNDMQIRQLQGRLLEHVTKDLAK